MIRTSEVWLTQPTHNCNGIRTLIREIRLHLEGLSFEQLIGSRSRVVTKRFSSFAASESFHAEANSLSEELDTKAATANLRVDRLLRVKSDGCLLACELALNNREAIGSNFAKVNISLLHRQPSVEKRFGVLITASRDFLDKGGWDRAYADTSEYRRFFEIGMSEMLGVEIVLLELTAT